MKITKEHYNYMKMRIKDKVENYGKIALKEHVLGNVLPKATNPDLRLRWDLFSSCLTDFACQELYRYCDDTHIETALKQIQTELGLRLCDIIADHNGSV